MNIRSIMKKLSVMCKDLLPVIAAVLVVLAVGATLISADSQTEARDEFILEPLSLPEIAEVAAASNGMELSLTKRELPSKEEAPGTVGGGASGSGGQTSLSFQDGGTYKDGTYSGSARGFGGNISVSVTVKGGRISSIIVTGASGETSSYFTKAKAVLNRIIDKQSPNVDTVSGATYSSNGLINAVKVALNKARSDGKEDETQAVKPIESESAEESTSPAIDEIPVYKNGHFTGTGQGFGGSIKVKVTIKKGKITEIEVVKARKETPKYLKKAKKLISSVIKKQSIDGVDAISGATFSSNGIKDAIANALKKALKNPPEDPEKPSESESESAEEPSGQESAESDESSAEEPSSEESSSDESQMGEESTSDTNPGGEESSMDESSKEESQDYKYADGSYAGRADVSQYGYQVIATVIIRNHEIAEVSVDTTNRSDDNESYIYNAVNGKMKAGKRLPGIPAQVVNQQGTDGVDAVSGATYTSKAILKAVNQALEAAQAAR